MYDIIYKDKRGRCFMLKIIVILVFAYNLVTTVSDPTVQDWIINGTLLIIGLGLVINVGKKTIGTIIKVVAVLALIGYALVQFGVISLIA